MNILDEISQALQSGEADDVLNLTRRAGEQKIPPREILDKGLIEGMNVIGEKFRKHEIFLPEVLLAAKAMYAGMDYLKPLFIGEDMPTRGKIVIGTVKGDLHDIGKNLVTIMLKGAGFAIIDLGKDVDPRRFVETAINEKAQIIGMSALLTTTMPAMGEVTALLREKNLQGSIRSIVGGAPLSEAFAREIGANAYAYDAARAVDCVKELTGVQ